MFELKPISAEAIPVALSKAERYRLLNEPRQAESICRDILRIEPENSTALIMLLLSLTDQFGKGVTAAHAREALHRLAPGYEQAYYAGIICERWAEALIRQDLPGVGFTAYENLREAMDYYEEAERLRPEGNDDSILRWNTCARILMRSHDLRPRAEEKFEPALED
jgi:tetratricopeptide (TPR) repeat protein